MSVWFIQTVVECRLDPSNVSGSTVLDPAIRVESSCLNCGGSVRDYSETTIMLVSQHTLPVLLCHALGYLGTLSARMRSPEAAPGL